MTTIEGEPSGAKATGLWLEAARKLNLWSERLEKCEHRAKHQRWH
jgi:hypothetical protein